ncbi:MAG: hypothetical protein F6K31_16210 [Symploca sp. SIO2G7]|nr:hypothetical protein [Symploca sp. SIO2G7]
MSSEINKLLVLSGNRKIFTLPYSIWGCTLWFPLVVEPLGYLVSDDKSLMKEVSDTVSTFKSDIIWLVQMAKGLITLLPLALLSSLFKGHSSGLLLGWIAFFLPIVLTYIFQCKDTGQKLEGLLFQFDIALQKEAIENFRTKRRQVMFSLFWRTVFITVTGGWILVRQ